MGTSTTIARNHIRLYSALIIFVYWQINRVFNSPSLFGYISTETPTKNTTKNHTNTKGGSARSSAEHNASTTNRNNTNNDTAGAIDDHQKPWMIIHVGPPKTGTTTIQDLFGSQEIFKMLALKDNIYYMGSSGQGRKLTHSLDDSYNKKNNTGVVTAKVFRMRDFVWDNSPLFTQAVRDHQKAGHNVVLSAEHFTSYPTNWNKLFENILLRPPQSDAGDEKNSTINNNDASPFGFRVKIVLTYRHFFDWLPSMYHQRYLGYRDFKDGKKMPGIAKVVEEFVSFNATDEEFVKFNPSRRSSIANNYKGVSGSLYAYHKWTSRPELYDRVDVFDMHQQKVTTSDNADYNSATSSKSLFANFVCQSLPSATNTCRFLRQDASSNRSQYNIVSRSRGRKELVTEQDKYRIIHEAYRRFEFPEEKKGKWFAAIENWFVSPGGGNNPSSPSLPSKEVIVPKICPNETTLLLLREQSLDTLWKMASLVRKDSLSRQQSSSEGSISSNNNIWSGNNQNDYEDLWQSSAPRDHLLLSRRYNLGMNGEDFSSLTSSSLPTSTLSSPWWELIRAAHDASFEKHVAKEKFCHVDVDELLDNDDFVRHVFSKVKNKSDELDD